MKIKKPASLDLGWIIMLTLAMTLAAAAGFFVGYSLGSA